MPDDVDLAGLTEAEQRMVMILLPNAKRRAAEELQRVRNDVEARMIKRVEEGCAAISRRIDRLIRGGDVKRKRAR
jgi:putative heme iron utilization protein